MGGNMRLLVPFALCIVVLGCAQGTATPTPAPSPTLAPGSSVQQGSAEIQRAEGSQGPFQLVFELPRNTWRTDEAVDGLATLALVNGGRVDLGGSGGGLLAFEFVEVNGSRRVEPVSTSDCAPYRLGRGTPITSSIKKSGGFTAEDPNANFYRAFLTDPTVRLPAGDWRITAIATFIEGKGCRGQSHTMTAAVLVHVTR
jgi:hypothetical protein